MRRVIQTRNQEAHREQFKFKKLLVSRDQYKKTCFNYAIHGYVIKEADSNDKNKVKSKNNKVNQLKEFLLNFWVFLDSCTLGTQCWSGTCTSNACT